MTLTIMLTATALVAAFSSPGSAKVTGPCVDCHTMHNSQDGIPMATDLSGAATTDTFAHLTRSSCIGCHKGPTVGDAPDVLMTYTGANDAVSAGGSFDVWSTTGTTDDAKVHNVTNITGLDITADSVNTTTYGVPGLDTEFTNMNKLSGGSADPADLTCAGAYGCHGTINDATLTTSDQGIRGFHHKSTAYRYLLIQGTNAEVEGELSSDWEAGGASDTNHNIYSADPLLGINKLCANCHPDFHGSGTDTKVAGSWIRHPTDNTFAALPTTGTGGWDITQVDTDYKQNPFAFTDLDALNVDPGTAYTAQTTGAAVSCLSCHRAHGTPYADLLRFPYDGQSAGTSSATTGCLGCHYKQR